MRGLAWGLDDHKDPNTRADMARYIKANVHNPKLLALLDLLDVITVPVVDKLNPAHEAGVVLEEVWFSADPDRNSPAENIAVFYLLARELKALAAKHGFRYTLAQNESPLTQVTKSRFLSTPTKSSFRLVEFLCQNIKKGFENDHE